MNRENFHLEQAYATIKRLHPRPGDVLVFRAPKFADSLDPTFAQKVQKSLSDALAMNGIVNVCVLLLPHGMEVEHRNGEVA